MIKHFISFDFYNMRLNMTYLLFSWLSQYVRLPLLEVCSLYLNTWYRLSSSNMSQYVHQNSPLTDPCWFWAQTSWMSRARSISVWLIASKFARYRLIWCEESTILDSHASIRSLHRQTFSPTWIIIIEPAIAKKWF